MLNRVDYIIPSSPLIVEDNRLEKVLLFNLEIFHILSRKNEGLVKKLEPVFKKNLMKKKYSNLQDQINRAFLKTQK